ncbi:MAG: NAD(+) synthase, partial [Salinispira sp.]
NKSELSVGYCTLYGDMSGALAVIGDVFKTEVYELCEHINRSNSGEDIIPREILTKDPSAELRPDQKDQDSLPPYRILDDILRQYFLQRQSAPAGGSEGIDDGVGDGLVRKIITMIARAEYKRYQAPPVLKVSPKAFGSGRRIPIARAFYENF